MESQPDDQGRAAVGAILNVQTDADDAGLMRMAQDCIQRMRRIRIEKELEEIQRSLPNLPEGERAAHTERAMRLTVREGILEGPRGLRIGDSLAQVISRFEHGEDLPDEGGALYGDAAGQQPPFGVMVAGPERGRPRVPSGAGRAAR